MTTKQTQLFGGNWTDKKLEMLRKYLVAYAKIMNKQPFNFIYIDAFAGTGYRERRQGECKSSIPPLLPEFLQDETQELMNGSPRIALEVEPSFMKYIFIEKNPKRFKELSTLCEEFPHLANRIDLINADCNIYLKDLCVNSQWTKQRAVLFLDPFGMQVEWETMEAIAKTKAIDVWILFPLGVAVNRLLKRNGDIKETWRIRLNRLFGTNEWHDTFYKNIISDDLFGPKQKIIKVCTLESISRFYIKHLKKIFANVADSPRPLFNSKGNPLFHLCFAVANPRGAAVAMKIADHILKG